MHSDGRLLRALVQVSALGILVWWLESLAGLSLPVLLGSVALVAIGSIWMRYGVRWVIEHEGLTVCLTVCALLGVVGCFAFMALGFWIGALAHLILVAVAVRHTLEEYGVTRALA